MGIAIEIVLGAIVAYWVAGATGLPFWMAALGIVAVYLAATRGHGIGGGGVGIFTTLGNMFRGMRTFAVGIIVFTGVMMIATRVMAVSNNYAYHQFQSLGWRPWLWPQGVAMDLLLWMSVAFLVAYVASRAAHGNPRIAGWIFAITAIVIFTTMSLPRLGEASRPKPKSGPATMKPGETQAWADTDQSTAERGVVPTAFCTAYRWSFGPRWPCGGGVPSLPKLTRAAATNATAYIAPALILRFDGFTPCDPAINYTFELDTQGDPVSLKFPGIPIPVNYSGKGTLNAPEKRLSGPVRVISQDSRKQARVRIWEVISIRR
jgi:hypothetical protein